jgi:hypothetical protein
MNTLGETRGDGSGRASRAAVVAMVRAASRVLQVAS